MNRQVSLVSLAFSTTLAVAVSGCTTDPIYHYADDVHAKYQKDEKAASIEAQLGCEGAHPDTEPKEDKTEREKNIPKSAEGKAWLTEACRIAGEFDQAEPFTSWPSGDADVWIGRRICRSQISASLEKIGDDSYVEVARIEIKKGNGQKLWEGGPEVDQGRLTGFSFVSLEQAFNASKDRVPAVDAFLTEAKDGKNPDWGTLRQKDSDDEKQKYADGLALVRKHLAPGQTVKSEGKSVLAYPVTGNDGDPSAVHYLRQSGDRMLVVTPLPGSNPANPCVSELWRQK